MATDLFERGSAGSDDPLLARLREVTAGQYEVAEELGRGGMAVVFLGKDLRLQRTVAIKVMDPRLSLIPGMAERFLQEARIAARLQHPNVIVVHDVQQMGDLIFFVMSLIEGGAVDEILKQGAPLPIEQARWILLEASRALAYAHSEGIVHRDMKPANILVNLKGEIILTDFGIAKAVDSSGLTKSGTQIGTPMYMSPEQFADRPVGPWSDQYALGITAYELIAGRAPFTGELYHLITAHLTKAPTPLSELRPDCPPFLADAVMRMLEKSAADRWGSLEELEPVFGADLARDAGGPRRQLAQRALELHRHRAATVRALSPRSSDPAIGALATPPATKSPISQVVVGTPRLTILVGDAVRPSVQVLDEGGRERGDVALRWTSRTPAVALVEGEGTLRGVSTGETAVEVAAGSVSQEIVVTVVPRPLASLYVHAPSTSIESGRAISLVAIALDDRGTRVDTPVQWSSASPDIVHVDSAGTALALGVGKALVSASAGELREVVELEGVPSRTELLSVGALTPPNETVAPDQPRTSDAEVAPEKATTVAADPEARAPAAATPSAATPAAPTGAAPASVAPIPAAANAAAATPAAPTPAAATPDAAERENIATPEKAAPREKPAAPDSPAPARSAPPIAASAAARAQGVALPVGDRAPAPEVRSSATTLSPGIKRLMAGAAVVVFGAVLWEFLPHGDTFNSFRPNRSAATLSSPNASSSRNAASQPPTAAPATPAPASEPPPAPNEQRTAAVTPSGTVPTAGASRRPEPRLTAPPPAAPVQPNMKATAQGSPPPSTASATNPRQASDSAPPSRVPAAPPPAPAVAESRPAAKPADVPNVKPPELPTADEVRLAADHVVDGVRSGSERSAELSSFLTDGASPKVARAGDVTMSGDDHGVVHAQFDLRLSKFDAGGRPVSRVSHVTIEVLKHDGVSTVHVLSFGALTKSK